MKIGCLLFFFVLSTVFTEQIIAQEKSPWTTGIDLYSSYVWRGIKLGTGPAIQPTVKYSKGGFTIAGWGSYCFSEDEAAEADLYMTYLIALGKSSSLTLNLSDYYYPGPTSRYFQGASHYFEPQVNLALGKFIFTGSYMFNEEATYFEAAYSAGPVTFFAGAGDRLYTKDAKFNLSNLGIKTTTAIKINDHFSIPVNGALVLNTSTEQFNVVVGITLANQ